MFQLTFKNVGQGDSIILEWESNKTRKIGLIDCNLFNNQNPVLDHIIKESYNTIEFLILSHPHIDHFSGFLQLIEYCATHSIRMKHFIHTCGQVPSYIQAASKSVVAERELQRLFECLHQCEQKWGLKVGHMDGNVPNPTITLNKELLMRVLSPTQYEFDNYVSGAFYPYSEEESLDNPKANWLSLILKIECAKWILLLTSDADKRSLIRIDKHEAEELDKPLIIGQIPHHGAFGNHNNTFWKKRKRIKKTAMIVSSGPNSYGHPSIEVLYFFVKNGYRVYSTSKNILSQDLVNYNNVNDTMINLDIYSFHEQGESSEFEGDQVFSIDVNGISYNYLPTI